MDTTLDKNNSTALFGYTGNSELDAGVAVLADFYTRTYPTAEELATDLEDLEQGELADIVAELRTEVEALREETGMFEYNVTQLRTRAPNTNSHSGGTAGAARGAMDGLFSTGTGAATGADGTRGHEDGDSAAAVAAAAGSGAGPARRGREYRRKSQEEADVLVTVTDKLTMLAKEGERLEQQEERATRQAVQVKDMLAATVEESQRRLKELRLEFRQFCREVLKQDGRQTSATATATTTTADAATATASHMLGSMNATELPDGTLAIEGEACADDLLLYMRRRVQSQRSYLDKLTMQCSAAEQDITRAQQQLRQRKAAGEAFNAVDFAQLKIENEQFNERIERKNAELAALKGTSTRAVQTLNSLTDALNDLNVEQAQLKKELKSRGEYLTRCEKEVTVVATEATRAESKNQTIKAQHEAVKVPKIEEYIAQTAELFELQKALKNWTRKVEIAEGQVKVLRQQTRKLSEQQNAAVAYAEAKLKKRQAAVRTSNARRMTGASSSSTAANIRMAAATAPPAGRAAASPSSSSVVVGGTKSLLQAKRGPATGKAAAAATSSASPSRTTAGSPGVPRPQATRAATSPSRAEATEASPTGGVGGTAAADAPMQETGAQGSAPVTPPADSGSARPSLQQQEPRESEAAILEDMGEDASVADGEATARAVAPTVAPASPSRGKLPFPPSDSVPEEAEEEDA